MILMEEHIEMTVSACYNQSGMRRIKLLKRLRIALVICLFMAWTYGVSIAAALISEGSGVATRWMLEFVMFTIPATVLLILVWVALSRLSRVFDYVLQEDQLEIWNCKNESRRALVAQINCFSLICVCPEESAPAFQGRRIDATVSKYDRWVLDVRHEGFTVRVFLQPDEELAKKLKSYVQQ